MVELLLEHGGDPAALTHLHSKLTPFLIAVRKGAVAIVRALFESSRRE